MSLYVWEEAKISVAYVWNLSMKIALTQKFTKQKPRRT